MPAKRKRKINCVAKWNHMIVEETEEDKDYTKNSALEGLRESRQNLFSIVLSIFTTVYSYQKLKNGYA